MAEQKLETLLSRLETAVTRIEACANKGGGGSSNDSDCPAFVDEFEAVLKKVANFVEISMGISNDVGNMASILQQAFQTVMDLLKMAGKCKSPAKDKLALIMKPTLDTIKTAEDFEKKSKERDYLNHLKAVCSMISGLTWPGIQSKPHNFVKEMTDSGIFYSNKVLKDFKEKDPKHKQWVQSLLDMFKELSTYVENFHSTGLTWNPKGSEPTGPAQSSAPATKTAAANVKSKPTGGAAGAGALFSQLNKGTSVTSGLKKVDDSQKTHKNPDLRATSVVKEKASSTQAAAAAASRTAVATVKPPLFELQVKKWVVEHQLNDTMLSIDEGDMSYTLYMFKCQGTTVTVDKKINSITMEACTKCNLILKSGIISSCEVINSKRCNIQADDVTPSVIIGNSDDVNVYLSPKALGTEVVTSKTTGINVLLINEGADLVELNIPEQYVTKVKNGKLVTEKADVV